MSQAINTSSPKSPLRSMSLQPQVVSSYSQNDLQDYQKFKEFIQSYIVRNYSSSCVQASMELTEEETQQLFYTQKNSVVSNESNMYPLLENQDTILNFEVKRTLLRLNCYQLLLENRPNCYQEFTRNQPKKEEVRLNQATFQHFSDTLKKLSAPAIKALRASCFMKMTMELRTKATHLGLKFSIDSEKFITDIISQGHGDLFPTYNSLDDEAKTFLSFIFLKNSHARHMQLCEGCENMFTVLKEKIQNSEINSGEHFERFQVWCLRWIIEDSAFEMINKHPDTQKSCLPQGSSNLKQPVALDYLFLFQEISNLIANKGEYDVFDKYLLEKSKQLGVKNKYLAQLGVQMRLSNHEGQFLNAWFENLLPEQRKKHEEVHAQFYKLVKATPTYEPAVFKNLRVKIGLGLSAAASIYAEVLTNVHDVYLNKMRDGRIAPDTSINFNPLLTDNGGKQLEIIVNQYNANQKIPDLEVNEVGVVSLAV